MKKYFLVTKQGLLPQEIKQFKGVMKGKTKEQPLLLKNIGRISLTP
jgi:hypothetical protein